MQVIKANKSELIPVFRETSYEKSDLIGSVNKLIADVILKWVNYTAVKLERFQ
jgi:hypothetical protein